MDEKQITALRHFRPDLNVFSDEELIIHCKNFESIVVELVENEGCAFIREKQLGADVEEVLCSALIYEAKLQAMWHITFLGPNDTLESFIVKLNKCIDEIKDKARVLWFDCLEERIMKVDTRVALHHINEGLFQLNRIELQHSILETTPTKDLSYLKTFFFNCKEYLSTKSTLEPFLKKQRLIEPKNNPVKNKEIANLIEIWSPGPDGAKAHYYKFISKLQEVSFDNDAPFVTNCEGRLLWNKTIKGSMQYLAAFIYTMTIKGWLEGWYSADEYQKMLEATFNIKFNKEPFKGLPKAKFDPKYLKPFKNWEANILCQPK